MASPSLGPESWRCSFGSLFASRFPGPGPHMPRDRAPEIYTPPRLRQDPVQASGGSPSLSADCGSEKCSHSHSVTRSRCSPPSVHLLFDRNTFPQILSPKVKPFHSLGRGDYERVVMLCEDGWGCCIGHSAGPSSSLPSAPGRTFASLTLGMRAALDTFASLRRRAEHSFRITRSRDRNNPELLNAALAGGQLPPG